ncbi:hypothetical protein GG851_05885 [Bordetella petrii]|nr:hypothetical protein [Bordetella petrii]
MNQTSVNRMGLMPPQKPQSASTEFQQRAVFFNAATAFMQKVPPVPDATFDAEAARALDPATPTSLIHCDLSQALQLAQPATTPHLLARYAAVRPHERLAMDLSGTSIAICYVIRGAGRVAQAGAAFDWQAGDVFLLPGGPAAELAAGPDGAVAWIVGNEPLLVREGLQPPPADRARIRAVHYPAAEIARQVAAIYELEQEASTAARALFFSYDEQRDSRNISPTLTLGYNTLEPGVTQRGHRHNSVAVSLPIQPEGCYSMIDGQRKDWLPWAATITPPCSYHSHHNSGPRRAAILVVQDGGIYTHARANGFSFD